MKTLLVALAVYRAFWADAFHNGYKTPAQVDQMIDDLAAAKANAVLVEVRRRGDAYYLQSLEPPAEDSAYSPSFDALQYAIERAHARGIEVHAWFPVTPLWTLATPPRDARHAWHRHGPNAAGEAMWMTLSSAGRMSTSLDPGHPGAARYLADVILEPARHYDLDGIHLDYIRYPEDADYGYNPTAVARFQRLENRTGWPAASDARWAEFRRRQVTQLVRQIYLRAFAIRPSIKVSVAAITWGMGPTSDAQYRRLDAYSRVFQDWRGWLEEGIVDIAIPMNYFREAVNAAMFEAWTLYQKDRQYGRMILPGLGAYLNPVPDTLAQVRRALERAPGVVMYSYATPSNTPAPDFYRALGELFGEAAEPPALAWKTAPSRGHLYGWLEVEGHFKDGATIHIESETRDAKVETVTDGGGFFGAVDLAPDLYRVRVERGGRELLRATPQPVAAGGIARFDIRLKPEDFAAVVPRFATREEAAPGDVLVLNGVALAAAPAWATAVPLPPELGRTQVVVNGASAPLFSVAPGRIELQLPFDPVETWEITVRHDGLESAPVRVAAVSAAPVILGVNRREDGYLEIYATGLGAVAPPFPAGRGAGPAELPRVALPVVVWAAGRAFTPSYAGLTPWYPGRYQVNVQLPPGLARGELRLDVGGRLSGAYVLN